MAKPRRALESRNSHFELGSVFFSPSVPSLKYEKIKTQSRDAYIAGQRDLLLARPDLSFQSVDFVPPPAR